MAEGCYQFSNIDFATQYLTSQARHALSEIQDIEVAILSENCTAVRQYVNEEAKRKHGFGGPKLSWSERMKDK